MVATVGKAAFQLPSLPALFFVGVSTLLSAGGAAAHVEEGHSHSEQGHSHGHDHSHAHSHSHGHGDTSGGEAYAEMLTFGFLPFPLMAMITITTTKVAFGLAPRYFRTNPRLLSLANAYSAGIFLAGGLCHLLPEASHSFEMLAHQGWSLPENMAFVFCGAGFMATLFIEKLLFMSDVSDKDSDKGEEMKETHSSGHGHSHEGEGHCHTHGISFSDPNASVLPFLLTAVLCFHSFVGGMALGITHSSTDTALNATTCTGIANLDTIPAILGTDLAGKAFIIFIAIISHKWVEAFSLGIAFVRAGTPPAMMVKFILGFASSSPVGIAAGWMLRSSVSAHGSMLVASLDAVASGTFIYISAVDLIAEEFLTARDKFAKFFALCGGFTTLVLLSWATPHEH